MQTPEAYIASVTRTAVGKGKRGTLKDVRPEFLGAEAIKGALGRVDGLDPALVDDVVIGCAFPEGPQGMNMARILALKAGLPDDVPGMTVNRFCSSGLQTIALAAQSIMAGQNDVVIAGGVESMSAVPMGGFYFSPDPDLAESDPGVYVDMGNTAENVAEKYGVSREDQDAFSLESHRRAIDAIESGRFSEEITPISFEQVDYADGELVRHTVDFDTDEGPRADTNMKALAKLRPVFRQGGTVTAGNSSQISDGAAAAVVASKEKLDEIGAKPVARFLGFAAAGVEPELMGIGPVNAIPKVLNRLGMTLSDIGLIELNEAFAAQSLAVIRELGLDQDIVNVNGGAIALGHPLGCTGTKLVATLIHEMQRRNVQFGLCTMCIGGGMGAAGVFELVG
ncbi:MAG: thiolase family protein [Bacteroidota bacterium]